MRIISKQPNESGAYPPIQDWCGETPPDTNYEVADGVTISYGGFGALTVIDNVVTAFTPNESAWNAWKAEHPEPTPQQTTEEKQAEQTRAQNATIAMMSSVINDLISDVEALKA